MYFLVGGFNPSERYSSNGIIVLNIWKKIKCSKPPTRCWCSPVYPAVPIVAHIRFWWVSRRKRTWVSTPVPSGLSQGVFEYQ